MSNEYVATVFHLSYLTPCPGPRNHHDGGRKEVEEGEDSSSVNHDSEPGVKGRSKADIYTVYTVIQILYCNFGRI